MCKFSKIEMILFLLCLGFCACVSIPKLTKSWDASAPAFLMVADNNLFVTSFSGSPFTYGSISALFNLSDAMRSTNAPTFTTIVSPSAGLLWPNQVDEDCFFFVIDAFMGDCSFCLIKFLHR